MNNNASSDNTFPLFLLLNKNINDNEIKSFLSNSNYAKKEIKEYIYLSSAIDGWSLCFRNNILEAIYLYNSVKPYSQYTKELPYKLNFSLVNTDIVQYFGDSKSKGGGNYPIWISYDHLGIEVHFLNMVWADNKNPITFFCLFDKDSKSNK